MQRVIMFCFAGREANMELQLPFIRRILAKHPNTEYHVWDLTHNPDDHRYLRTIRGDRISVRSDFYNPNLYNPGLDFAAWREQFNNVHQHYTRPAYQDCLFVKIDEDVVFIESDRFGVFLDAVDANRGSIVSAEVVNNDPNADPVVVHNNFFEHWGELVGQPVSLRPCTGRLTINMVGYDWQTGRKIVDGCETDPERVTCLLDVTDGVATVLMVPIGDEDAANTLPRLIMRGFVACHLYFGMQRLTMNSDHIADLQKRYAEIGQEYRRGLDR